MNRQSNGIDTVYNRREFLRNATGASLAVSFTGLATEGCADLPKPAPRDVIRIGFVGVGGMGFNDVMNLLKIDGAEIRAVCDIVPEKVADVQEFVAKSGGKRPAGYAKGPTDFQRMCDQEQLDLVYTATPWEWHTPICLYAMKTGKHAATEVPAAVSVDECWQLVETAEKTSKHCVMMENCCYDRTELMVLNMVRRGLFGELVHAECGYMHDLRSAKFGKGGEGLWRRAWAMKCNGNLYPTHGLGPVAQWMKINRGDRMEFLVSMSSLSKGLQAYAGERLPPDDPRRKERYMLGDVNSTLIRTVNGLTVLLQHDTNLPRPYSRMLLLQGTKGLFRGFPDRIHIEGRSPGDDWEDLRQYREEFEHPLWKAMGERSKGAARGGMDFLEDYRLIHALRRGEYPDLDVYDAVTWSAPFELTQRSVANRSRPVDFPDFTRGRWKARPPMEIIQA
jgi:hypothetical protein